MTADEARAITRKAVKFAADARLVEDNMDRWFSGVRAAALKGVSFYLFEASPGPALDESVRQMAEAGFTIGSVNPAPGGILLVETSW